MTTETTTQTVPVEALRLRVGEAVDLRSSEGERTKFQMLAHSGQPFQHWLFGNFAVDLAGLRVSKQKKPVLLEHDPEKRVGYTESFSVTDKGLQVEGHFLKTSKLAQEIVADSKDGFPFEASISFERVRMQRIDEGETAEVNGYEFTGPGRIVRESEFREVSFVALGADMHTSAEALANGNGATETIEVTSRKDVEMSKDAKTTDPVVTVESIKAEHPDIAAQLNAEGRDAAIAAVVEVLAAAKPDEHDLAIAYLRRGMSAKEAFEFLALNPARKTPPPPKEEPKSDPKKDRLDALSDGAPKSPGPSDKGDGDGVSRLTPEERWARLSREQRDEFFGDIEQFKWSLEQPTEEVTR